MFSILLLEKRLNEKTSLLKNLEDKVDSLK